MGEGELAFGGRMLPTPPLPDDMALALTPTSLPLGLLASSSTASAVGESVAPESGFLDTERMFPAPPLPEEAYAGLPRDCERSTDSFERIEDVSDPVDDNTLVSLFPRFESESVIESLLPASLIVILAFFDTLRRREERGGRRQTKCLTNVDG